MLFMLADADRGIDDVVQACTFLPLGGAKCSHWPDYSAIDHALGVRLRIGFPYHQIFASHVAYHFVEGLLAQLTGSTHV